VTVAGSVDPELVVVVSSRRRKEGRKEGRRRRSFKLQGTIVVYRKHGEGGLPAGNLWCQ
jgi:hypothetical protein